MHHRRHRIQGFLTFLSREDAQAKPDKTVTLAVISGSSFLALTRFSENGASAVTSLVRLFT
ncbi:MAG TPA: hypothetical protein VIL96_07665 [Gaiellaceae bacterium]